MVTFDITIQLLHGGMDHAPAAVHFGENCSNTCLKKRLKVVEHGVPCLCGLAGSIMFLFWFNAVPCQQTCFGAGQSLRATPACTPQAGEAVTAVRGQRQVLCGAAWQLEESMWHTTVGCMHT